MWTLEFFLGAASSLISFGFGAWFYRWMLRRDPTKLERWAQELKKLGEQAKAKLD